jgi:hypothetical protein
MVVAFKSYNLNIDGTTISSTNEKSEKNNEKKRMAPENNLQINYAPISFWSHQTGPCIVKAPHWLKSALLFNPLLYGGNTVTTSSSSTELSIHFLGKLTIIHDQQNSVISATANGNPSLDNALIEGNRIQTTTKPQKHKAQSMVFEYGVVKLSRASTADHAQSLIFKIKSSRKTRTLASTSWRSYISWNSYIYSAFVSLCVWRHVWLSYKVQVLREQITEMENAARLAQLTQRCNQARQTVQILCEQTTEKENAARRIQCTQRCKRARQKVNILREQTTEKENAARPIQCTQLLNRAGSTLQGNTRTRVFLRRNVRSIYR